jgi:hypothetical protein
LIGSGGKGAVELMFLKFFQGKKPSVEGAAVQAGRVRGIDMEMKYCPVCQDEYRSDISVCAVCGAALRSGAEYLAQKSAREQALAGRSMDLNPEEEMVDLRRAPLQEVKALQKILAAERIPAVISGDEAGCGKGCRGPEMHLLIRSSDLPAATAILTKEYIKSTALESHDLRQARAVLDDQNPETLCPACGCRFPTTVGACPECGLCFD